jgi:hypothetical protein
MLLQLGRRSKEYAGARLSDTGVKAPRFETLGAPFTTKLEHMLARLEEQMGLKEDRLVLRVVRAGPEFVLHPESCKRSLLNRGFSSRAPSPFPTCWMHLQMGESASICMPMTGLIRQKKLTGCPPF